MNTVTQKIKSKGYSLPEAMPKLGISLRTYRRYEQESNPNHAMLLRIVGELECKE